MKAKLKFNLNDEQDRTTFSRISKLSDVYSLLWNLDQELRNKIKYGNLPDVEHQVWTEVRELYHNLLTKYKVDLDDY